MRFLRFAALAAAAALSIAAKPAEPKRDWVSIVTATPAASHLQGNPQAPIKLAEYVSYTCSHCANFQKQAHAPLQIGYIGSGKVSVEIRHLILNPVDMTVTMLTHCLAPNRFMQAHNMFLQSQDTWLKRVAATTSTQQQRWNAGPYPARMRAIAADVGLYAMVERYGLTRVAADRCLADEGLTRRLMEQVVEAERLGVNGTPTFMINGEVVAGVHDWTGLDQQLKSRLN